MSKKKKKDKQEEETTEKKPSSRFSLFRKRLRGEEDEPVVEVKGSFLKNPFLNEIRPKEGYYFKSDHFEIDGSVAAIYTFVNRGSSRKLLPAFWGINQIPQGLSQDTTIVLLETVDKMTESWIDEHQRTADKVASFNATETARSANNRAKREAVKSGNDMAVIADELTDGASYLNIHFRLMIKAPNLEKLEKAEDAVVRWYQSKFSGFVIEQYQGGQRRELAGTWKPGYQRQGKGFYMTSTEFAGHYNLVTQGLTDTTGSFIGNMVGDVNNSGVLMNINQFDNHVVIASDQRMKQIGKQYLSDLWALKMSNATLMDGRRVIHLVLNNADLVNIGYDLSTLTSVINMNEGDVNPLEVFGEVDENGHAPDELSAFAAHITKLQLMLSELHAANETDKSIINAYLSKVLTDYYVSEKMWAANAKEKRDRLRIVGLPHESYPRLHSLVATMNRFHKSELSKGDKRDPNDLVAINVIKGAFTSLLDNNGDLFDVVTNDVIDNTDASRRVIYDFSSLRERGVGLAMAQLVNILDFATKRLDEGDLLLIHGAELIEPGVQEFLTEIMQRLNRRGTRVGYVYNNVERMLEARDFNRFDSADYTVISYMSDAIFAKYVGIVKKDIPDALIKLITKKSSSNLYIRRGADNVVCEFEPRLDVRR